MLTQLNESRSQLEELWAARKMKLDLCLQLRIFERDAMEVGPPRYHFIRVSVHISSAASDVERGFVQ